VKYGNFDARLKSLLSELCARIPFLKLKSIRRDDQKSGSRADWLVELETKGRSWVWVVEGKRQGQPREVRNGLLQLRDYLDHMKGKACYGVLVAPFLSEESAQMCSEAGVGYADLAGNARLSFDQVFIETHAADNPFRTKRHLRSIFGAKAGRVLRVLLTPPLRSWKVKTLASDSGVSLGQVSNVRKLLLDREWAAADSDGLRLSQPEKLARAWQGSYQPRLRSREGAYTLLHDEALEDATKAALAEADRGGHLVLASYSAARWLAPYARQATQFLYADEEGAEVAKRFLQLQPVDKGENVVLFEPREDDVFAGRLEAAPGVWCTGLVPWPGCRGSSAALAARGCFSARMKGSPARA
jgi:hypothetical protein